jgi:hypothetical protein
MALDTWFLAASKGASAILRSLPGEGFCSLWLAIPHKFSAPRAAKRFVTLLPPLMKGLELLGAPLRRDCRFVVATFAMLTTFTHDDRCCLARFAKKRVSHLLFGYDIVVGCGSLRRRQIELNIEVSMWPWRYRHSSAL